ncbi:MAG: serine/threonine-protein phosphatase [Betaproteobacteria bacterium]|nr:serine/threonine-protein phosphatase [Betaproteobacteria bacterium]
MRFTIHQESRPGKRPSNQDRVAYCYSRDALLMVVADGMGGHLHGEIAAQIAVQYLTESFRSEAAPALADPFAFLENGLTRAHHAIYDWAAQRQLADHPRTTCVACVVQNSVAYWAHVGDSRLYLIRDGRVTAQTRDHTRVRLMVERGELDELMAANHPSRNKVYSCLGGSHAPQMDFSRKTPLHAGDVVVLCSDGLWGPLGSELLSRRLRRGNLLEETPRLLDEAEELGGATCDNLSVVAMAWHDDYDDVAGAISTLAMPLDAFTTEMEAFAELHGQPGDVSDEEIERAIRDITAAIRKYSK